MFSHLKKLIFDNVGELRSRRPNPMPRFRGQLEQLESRTVLSATMGPLAVEFVAIDFDANSVTVIAVWESRTTPTPQLAIKSFDQFGDAPWENLAWHGQLGGPRVGNLAGPPIRATGGNDQNSTIGGGYAGSFAEDKQPLTHPKDLPLGLQSGNQPGSSSFVTPTNESRGQYGPTFLTGGNATVADSYFSSLANSPRHSVPTTSVPRSSLKTQDTVFDAYSANSLLLASNVGSKQDLPGKLDDEFNSPDEKPLADDDDKDSLVEKDVTAALDGLQRERAAVDTVLAELHEIRLNRESHRPESISADQTRNRATAEASDGEPFTDANRMASKSANRDADGGMVLLQPSGDANSSAYDLTAAYFSGLGDNAALPLGVEVSVGMYQAIDVGTSDLRPSSRETLPLAQPAGAARPSVSAENAPAKRSEQPS